MKKNGFTLIEMLAVVIILTLLTLLIMPNVINSIKSYQSTTDSLSMAIIESAADSYIDDYKNSYPSHYGNTYCITINKLVDLGYLKKPVKYQDEDITDLKTLKVTYDDTYEYELVDKGTCIIDPLICTPVDEDNLTTGTVPSKDENGNIIFTQGDEYICEVKEDVKYRFFVLSTEGEKVNLIMDRNITIEGEEVSVANLGLVEWINEIDYTKAGGTTWSSLTDRNAYGPVSALDFLYNATSSWINVPNMIMDYTDLGVSSESGGYGTIKTVDTVTTLTKKDKSTVVKVNNGLDGYTNLKTRLPRINEFSGNISLSTWIYNYLEQTESTGIYSIPGVKGYWCIESGVGHAADPINTSWAITAGIKSNRQVESTDMGIRPVITITSENINY